MINLKAIWDNLASTYCSNDELINDFWQEIERSYSTNKRHYHNLQHLQYMMERAFQYKNKLLDPDTLLFSIFYHDIIYNVNRGDNEEKSADIACARLTELGLPPEKIHKCGVQILATKDHRDTADKDTSYLVDFDLAILGDSPENYRDYARKIRKEYAVYPDLLYKAGRKKVLRHFLNMDRIFKTDEFQVKFEVQARANLEMELSAI